ncbi:MAG TPA: hypothetical protein VF579_07480, partial [Candidatus Methylomirabilis sp.]
LLAVGALVLGSGYTFAAESTTKALEKSSTAEASKATAGKSEEAKESKVEKGKEARAAAMEKGEKEIAPNRIVRGEVTAVEASATPPTVTVKVMRGKSPETVAVEVPSSAKITSGKVGKSLTDITIGSRVWMRYDRLSDRLVADQIHLLPAGHSKAVNSGKKSGATATPTSAKSESSTKS